MRNLEKLVLKKNAAAMSPAMSPAVGPRKSVRSFSVLPSVKNANIMNNDRE